MADLALPLDSDPCKTLVLSVAYFRAHSDIDPATGCWIWNGPVFRGYGSVSLPSGKKTAAHRVSYQVANNIVLTGDLCACHKCDNPKCVNPDHIFAGTRTENMQDMVRKGRTGKPRAEALANRLKRPIGSGIGKQMLGEYNPSAKMTPDKVIAIRALDAPMRIIARQYGLDPKTVRQIKNREIWKHVP